MAIFIFTILNIFFSVHKSLFNYLLITNIAFSLIEILILLNKYIISMAITIFQAKYLFEINQVLQLGASCKYLKKIT